MLLLGFMRCTSPDAEKFNTFLFIFFYLAWHHKNDPPPPPNTPYSPLSECENLCIGEYSFNVSFTKTWEKMQGFQQIMAFKHGSLIHHAFMLKHHVQGEWMRIQLH